jgi:hypothetical protein
VTALLLAPLQRVEAQSEHAGNQLQLGVVPAVLARAGIRRDRFRPCVAEVALRTEPVAQRRRKALVLGLRRIIGGVGLAADDETKDPVFPAQALERENFCSPSGTAPLWRADHDLAG